jgi:AraC-like DNA-binding protein
VGKGNGVDIAGWLVSPGVRSIYAEGGAVLLDIKDGCCYSLNGVAACVWVTLEGSPGGISFDGIVDVLETHFNLPREALERAARDCLADLQQVALLGEKIAGGEESCVDLTLLSSRSRAAVHEFRHEVDRIITGKQPFVQRLETLESLVDRLFPQGVENNVDWRAKKVKDSIDNAPGKVIESLAHVCSQLQLSLSYRQARRLFKEDAGISMGDYARKRRLVFAARQLENTDEPIKVIATDAGYHTHHGFRKAFYDMFRLTPAEFRRFWQRRHVSA